MCVAKLYFDVKAIIVLLLLQNDRVMIVLCWAVADNSGYDVTKLSLI